MYLAWQSPDVSWKALMQGFHVALSEKRRLGLIESFAYMNFQGPIRMRGADLTWGVIEEYSRGVCRARPKSGQCRSLSQGHMLMCIDVHHMQTIGAAVNVGNATHMEYQGLFIRSQQEYVLIHSKCYSIVLAPCHGIDS